MEEKPTIFNSKHNWYRSTDWDVETETKFFSKLQRARASNKQQYLRIQASYLTKSFPVIALKLLDLYFANGADCDEAEAYCEKAKAYTTLNDIPLSLRSYEMALECEKKRPNIRTNAYLDLSFLVASHKLSERYVQCLTLLNQNKAEARFPVQHFLWYSSKALILSDNGDYDLAINHAKLALEAANKKHSGLTRHPTIGLVDENYQDTRKLLENIVRNKKSTFAEKWRLLWKQKH